MRITKVPFAVLRFQYQLVRFPLQLIEERVVSRMGTEAPARLFYERTLGGTLEMMTLGQSPIAAQTPPGSADGPTATV